MEVLAYRQHAILDAAAKYGLDAAGLRRNSAKTLKTLTLR